MTFAHPKALGAIAAAALAAAWARPAGAHIQLVYPAQRTEQQKTGPCGNGGGARSDAVTVLPSGGKVVVEWDETIEHPGHFRVSFDDDGDDDFVDPASFTDTYTNAAVLVDDIEDRNVSSSGERRYRQEIDLPDIECENCTLQVIQVMTDKGPVYGDNDLYYQCADVSLRRDAPGGGGGGGSDGGAGAGSGSNGGAGGGSNGPGGVAGAGQGRAGGGGASRGGGASGSGRDDTSADGDNSDGGCSYRSARGRGGALGVVAALAALAALGARRRSHRARVGSAR